MLLYTLDDQASVTGFIDLLGIAEPDQLVSGVLAGVIHSVIKLPRREAQRADGCSDWFEKQILFSISR